jgi:hypothetical protein
MRKKSALIVALFCVAAIANAQENCQYGPGDYFFKTIGTEDVAFDFSTKLPLTGVLCVGLIEAPYKDGKMEGTTRTYYKSGELKQEMPYKNDKAEGVARDYYESGKLESEIPYKNDAV